MAYMALYRKWRPQTFEDCVGQGPVITALRNQILYNRVGHAYLFCGTRGTGKTSTAKIFARAVNCLNPQNGSPCNECELCKEAEAGFNLIEIDAASHTGVENIREIRDEVKYTPAKGKYRIYIIDEVHMLSAGAFNALLKTLEEPPEHVIFILATTEPHKVLPTIVSRCQRYDFKRFTVTEILEHLRKVCESEGLTATEDALRYVARAADGGMRDALSIMEQCISFYMNEEITLPKVLAVLGASDNAIYYRMTEAVAARRMAECLEMIGQLFMDGRDASAFLSGWTAHLRNLLMVKALGVRGASVLELGEEEVHQLNEQGNQITAEQLTYYIESLSELESRMKYASEKRVLLEVGLIRLCRMGSADHSDSGLEARIAAMEQKLDKGIVVQQSASTAVQPAVEKKQQPKEEAPAPARRPVSGNTAAVFEQWAGIKKKIIKKNPGMYILNMMELRQGEQADLLRLYSQNPIYCDQLKQRGGEKLRIIEQVIGEETGIAVRVDTQEQRAAVVQQKQDDFTDVLSSINGDITWE